MPILGYYDGTSVRTDAKLELNQKVMIFPMDDIFLNESEGTAAGMLHEYANPQLQSEEKEAWKKAMVEKHG
ncbi:MAG: hypothetical protein J6M27_03900 [Lachnospiraceae bacterium]|nr:hypothetical protein [Lachnospiraceae bacterium]